MVTVRVSASDHVGGDDAAHAMELAAVSRLHLAVDALQLVRQSADHLQRNHETFIR